VKTLRLFGCIAILAFAQSIILAQNGQRFAYTCTDEDQGQVLGHRVYRIPLDTPGQTVQMGLTNVAQELEGFASIDNFSAPGTSHLFGVAENPDGTGVPGAPSVLVDLTFAARVSNGLGRLVGPTGIMVGTEAGAAWNHLTDTLYSVASDDRAPEFSQIFAINPLTGEADPVEPLISGRYIDGLAVGGDGTLYGTDARLTGSLYVYDFDADAWILIGAFNAGEVFAEDTGLANYRGLSGTETNLYMLTEGDGARLGRLWTIDALTGQANLVGNITLADGTQVPEDLEGIDIPFQPLDPNFN
jgi:hypothetical protein